jgi:DnaJ family protein C protein 28
MEQQLERVKRRRAYLRSRRVPPFASEKHAFNASVEKAASEYERGLRNLNRKILTLNVKAPSALHQPMLDVEKLVAEFRASCPLFKDI